MEMYNDDFVETNLEEEIGDGAQGGDSITCPVCGDSSVHLVKVHVSSNYENACVTVGPEQAAIEFYCENCLGTWLEAFYSHEGTVSKYVFKKAWK